MDFLLGGGAVWFTAPAIAGTVFLVAQLVLGQLGGHDGSVDGGGGFDAGHGGDLGGHDADFDHDSPGHEFRLLSLQSIAAFAMGAGWMGLAALRILGLEFGVAALIGVACGVGLAWMLAWMLRSMMKLQESGNISLRETVGEHGTVYVQIPPAGQGSGRVTVTVRSRQREYNAVQHGAEFLASHTGVRVIDVDASANALVVEPA